jgi:hypothetical protein
VIYYGLDDPGSNLVGGKIFLFCTVSRLTLGLLQPPIQWVPGVIFPGVKWLGHESDKSPPSSAKFKNGGRTTISYLPF